MKKNGRTERVKISTAGEWRRSFSVQAGNRRKEGTRETEHWPGGGGVAEMLHGAHKRKHTTKKLQVINKEIRKQFRVDKMTT